MADYLIDLRDIRFVLFDQIGIGDLLGKAPFADYDAETLSMMLDEATRFARDVLAPLNLTCDRVGVSFADGEVTTPPGMKEAFETFARNGWIGLTNSVDFGGQGAPFTLGAAVSEIFEGACLAFHLTKLLTNGAGRLIEVFGTEGQRRTFVPKMYSGAWTGTMCLTEAGAGSDVGACRTAARPEGDHHLIEGEKIFITSGEHDITPNIVHLVLARTPGAPAGTRGLSLFIVPKMRVEADGSLGASNHVRCLRIEEKLGIHGSPTCVMAYGADGPCHGYLLGQEGSGMKLMFQLMNEARITVGMEGAALGNQAYLQALAYAKERVQGRDLTRRKEGAVAIAEHPDVRRMLLWQKAHGEGIRALGYLTNSFEDRAESAHAAGDEDEARRCRGIVDVLTPVLKAYGSDTGFQICDMALQVFGGYGYTQEYPAEQLLRDARISRIYEGANGIQGMDLVGRKLVMHGGAEARETLAELQRIAGSLAGHGEIAPVAKATGKALQAVGKAALGFAGALAGGDVLSPFLHATPFLEIFGQTVIGLLLGQQAAIALDKLAVLGAEQKVDPADEKALRALAERNEEVRFLHAKVQTARFFAHHVLSLVPARADLLLGGDTSPMEVVL